MQRAVVLEVMQQHHRHAVRGAAHYDRSARHADRARRADIGQEQVERQRAHLARAPERVAPGAPGGHYGEHGGADREWQPATVHELHDVGDEERHVHHEEQREQCRDRPRLPAETHERHIREQQRSNDHRSGDGDAVGGGERGGPPEAHRDHDARDHQRPVHVGHVDLPGFARGGVHDARARPIAELHGLAREREHAGDERLRSNYGRGGGEREHRVERPAGSECVEGVLCRAGVAQQDRALAEVVEDQRGQHDPEPRGPNRRAAEVAEIGVERLGAGNYEHDGAEDEEPDPA